jgi:hypothetical protein
MAHPYHHYASFRTMPPRPTRSDCDLRETTFAQGAVATMKHSRA